MTWAGAKVFPATSPPSKRRDRPARTGQRVLQLFLKHALRDGFFRRLCNSVPKIAPNGDIIALISASWVSWMNIPASTPRSPPDHSRLSPRGRGALRGGYVPPDRDIDTNVRAARSVGEPIFGMDASRISMGRLGLPVRGDQRFGMKPAPN